MTNLLCKMLRDILSKLGLLALKRENRKYKGLRKRKEKYLSWSERKEEKNHRILLD